MQRVGILCAGLTPLLRNEGLARYRARTMYPLYGALPDVREKCARFLDHGHAARRIAADRDDLNCSSRIPGVSLYQVLGTYDVVRHMWRQRNLQRPAGDADSHRAEIGDWIAQTLKAARPHIEQELGGKAPARVSGNENCEDVEAGIRCRRPLPVRTR